MKIEVLFPDVANLYGDIYNAKYLAMCVDGCETINTGLNDTPAFVSTDVDVIYMAPMPEFAQELVVGKLAPYKERIVELIDKGTVFFVTGNALEVFGQYIENEDGSRVDCLGIFDTYAKRNMMDRYNALFLGNFGNMKIVGFKAQFSHSYGGEKTERIFECLKGCGLNPDDKGEGIRRNNFFGTYLIGPLLVMVPDFTKYILSLAGEKVSALPFEDEMTAAYKQRIKEFERPDIELAG